jgi:hypothetical protein
LKLLFLIPFLIALKINSQVLEFSLSKEGDNLSNLPFYVGIDAGSSVRLKEKENYCKLGFSIYMNINLYRRIVFLRSKSEISIKLSISMKEQPKHTSAVFGLYLLVYNL